jgi:4-amino-4-deoxy-L-arabinose transferase-like glycosyltransferase
VPTATPPSRSDPVELLWHILLIAGVSAAFESLFLHHGIGWLFDEGWPLYAAMQLHQGGILYGDVFFLFPPGHLLPAWIAYALDPPGVVLARIFYAGFNVSLCVALYLLARRITQPPFALLAALLLAVAAPRSHLAHLLFGYRYLVFSVLALLAFSARLRTGNRAWMVAAGLGAGVALFFRLTPAFAVSCGIGVAVMCTARDWRSWMRDWGAYALGMVAVLVPVLAWFAGGVGSEAVWDQAVMRILPLQSAQEKPIPDAVLPTAWDRQLIYQWFVPVQYWLYPAVYAAYAVVLAWFWIRSVATRRSFDHALLVAIVIWGGIYILRALGRSDEHHLTSALPPACLMLAHALGIAVRAGPSRWAVAAPWAASAIALAVWVLLQGSDLYLDPARRGIHPIRSLAGRVFTKDWSAAKLLDRSVKRIEQLTRPDQTVLDLTHSPLIYVLAKRRGPGFADVVTPGVFADPEDEREFVEHLKRNPPALVLWPKHSFDDMRSRSLEVQTPLLSKWVGENYVRVDGRGFREIALKRRN